MIVDWSYFVLSNVTSRVVLADGCISVCELCAAVLLGGCGHWLESARVVQRYLTG